MGLVVAPGFDQREAQVIDGAVWAVQTGEGQRLGRVNTEVSELDAVRELDSPTDVIQFGSTVMVFSAAYSALTVLDGARLGGAGSATGSAAGQSPGTATEATASPTTPQAALTQTAATPPGTTEVVSQGDSVAYLAADGDVLVGRISDGTAAQPTELTIAADGQEGAAAPTGLRAEAVAVTAAGEVAALSLARSQVVTARVDGTVTGADALAGLDAQGEYQVTFDGAGWVVLEAQTGQLWRAGATSAVATGATAGARLQNPTEESEVYIADGDGLIRVPAQGEPERVFGTSGVEAGAPAAPTAVDGVVYAAWLPAGSGTGAESGAESGTEEGEGAAPADPDPSTGAGALWSSAGPVTALSYGDHSLGQRREPSFRVGEGGLILNESRSGWVWDIPSGDLVRSSQDWVPQDAQVDSGAQEEVAAQVREPRAPVAVNDAFGVRPGRQVRLPVLLNDHDANGDVLTIDPAQVTASGFAQVSVSEDGQSLVATVAPTAQGSATVSYAVTDGTTEGGLTSAPATVTLTVTPDEDNAAPVWCGVDACLREWPVPQVAPGGTVTVEVLEGWVDPNGDALYVASAAATQDASVAASPTGTIVVRAPASGTEDIEVAVTVADAQGVQSTRRLRVVVVGEAALVAEPVATTVVVGTPATVPVTSRVTGASGPMRVAEASVDPRVGARVAIAPGGEGVTVTADAPGSYRVDATVTDGRRQVRVRVRVTAIPAEQEALTTVPLTAFVRPHEDVTVDVLGAVDNPAGRVLLVSDAVAQPQAGARLQAQVVGHGQLRLAGSTADAAPGTLGVVRYTVTDGSGRASMTIRGEVTVILLDADVPPPPLATDDAVTVRAGGQVDVRVLDNDVAAAGAVTTLDGGSVAAPPGAGLAFAAGPIIRYMAPDAPGTYLIPYAVYALGYPSGRDTATVTVTVTGGEDNAAPTPRELSGRVASGEEVTLPLDSAGADPDGDAVAVDAVIDQPAHGSARVSADGTALVYLSALGYAGQDSFTYSVTDARGLTAVATARVGVIATDADPAPVTYTDFIEVQASEGRAVVVSPLANDLDLTGGSLELIDVRPDAVAGSAEEAALAAGLPAHLNGADQRDQGTVTVVVGATAGTYAYLYTARNAVGSLAQGRIVIKTVREPVIDLPIIADTVLTAATRESFATGVDVLAGTVSWASGDARALTVSLWGDVPDVTVTGSRLSGPLPQQARLIPFQVDGIDVTGTAVTSYGFLQVPGADEVRVTVREGAAIVVDEGGSAVADLGTLVAVPPGWTLDHDADAVVAGGARDQGRCTAVGATSVRYEAGKGAPLTDTCVVRVRLTSEATQTPWAVLALPVTVVPEAPVPVLNAGSVEVSPGATATFDLVKLVGWPAGVNGADVELAARYNGQLFDVTRVANTVTIRAKDDSPPGAVEAVNVSLPDYPDVAARAVSLVVGPAPVDLPKGGSVVARCSQASGDSCLVTVTGAPGEVNPLPATALEVVSVTAGADCPAVTFTVEGSSAVRARWLADAPGSVCHALFTVRDAQGRVSAGERSGTLSLDLQGFPAAPAAVTQVAFGDGTATLGVNPGRASAAYPALTGFDILDGTTRVATCTPTGMCTPLTGLVNGEVRTYSAVAVNSVGRSRGAVSTQAWAYAPPAAPSVISWTPSVTSGAGGRIDLVLDVADRSTREILVTVGGSTETLPVRGTGRQEYAGLAVGSNQPVTVSLTPVSGHAVPTGGASTGSAVTFSAHGIGRPELVAVTARHRDGDAAATVSVTTSSGGATSTTWVGWSTGGECRPDTAVSGTSTDLAVPVEANATTTVTVCADSRVGSVIYGQAPSQDVVVTAYVDPGAPMLDRGYQVADSCVGATACTTALLDDPRFRTAGMRGAVLMFRGSDGSRSASFGDVLAPGKAVTVEAYWCVDVGGERRCSEQTTAVTARTGPAYRPTVALPFCTVGTQPQPVVGAAAADVVATVTMRDADGAVTADFALMRTAGVDVTFRGALAGMNPWASEPVTCDGVPPEPEPSTPPTP